MEDFGSFNKVRGRGLDIRKLNSAIRSWITDERKRMSTHGQVRQPVSGANFSSTAGDRRMDCR